MGFDDRVLAFLRWLGVGLRGRFVIDWGEGKREGFFARFFSSYSNDSVFFLSFFGPVCGSNDEVSPLEEWRAFRL